MTFGKMSGGMSNWFAGAAGRKAAVIALGTLAAVALATGVHAQDAAYIRVVGPKGAIAGTAKDAAHQGWIVVSKSENVPTADEVARESSAPSVSELTATKVEGKTAPAPSSTSATAQAQAPRDVSTGLATGRRMHQPITIWKPIDSTSPLLKEMQTTGARLSEVDIQMSAKPGQTATSYKLSDVMINSISATSGDKPMESISFTFQKIEMMK
jgi:type VI secretion system secreted protein Hcp